MRLRRSLLSCSKRSSSSKEEKAEERTLPFFLWEAIAFRLFVLKDSELVTLPTSRRGSENVVHPEKTSKLTKEESVRGASEKGTQDEKGRGETHRKIISAASLALLTTCRLSL